MENTAKFDAIIIGGGIGGLCSAIALQYHGIRAQVYEQASAIRNLGTGLSIWPNALKALDKIGIGDKVRALGVRDYSGGGIFTWQGHPLAITSQADMNTYFGELPVVIHRAELHQLLIELLEPGSFHLSSRCDGFSQSDEQVTAHFEDGTQVSASLLIASDGLRSAVRQKIAPVSSPTYAGYNAWRGVTTFAHKRIERWGEFWGVGSRFGLAPLSNNRVYWFSTANGYENQHHNVDADSQKAHLIELFQGWDAPIPEIIQATDATAILSNAIYELPPIKNWVSGRIALLGDAAHAMTPNLGQGACQAIEDAVVLAQLLHEYQDIQTVLKSYEHSRVPRTTKVVKLSHDIGVVGQWSNPLACSIRDMALKAIPPRLRLNSLKSIVAFEV